MEKINIGGIDRPIEFGWNGLRIFCRLSGVALSRIDRLGEDMTPDDITHLVYAGLKHGAERSGEGFPHSVDDVGEWIGDDMSVVAEAIRIFQEQMPKSKNPEAPAEGAAN